MKKVLVIYFTQSGQQRRILEALLKPFADSGHEVHFEELKPVKPFPFPWTAYQFFNAFPETFKQELLPLQPLSEKAFGNHDLVILGYQPWFLTPSRPVSTFLQSGDAKRILNNRYVVTVLGCRNMWLGGQEKVKHWLRAANARLVGHIALADKGGNLTSLITILHWMLTGKKEPFWFFPEAGVSQRDIQQASVFGNLIKDALNAGRFDSLQEALNGAGAIEIKPSLVLMEKRGQKSFSVWARFVSAGGNLDSAGRKIRVYLFMYLLPTMIFILTPLLWILSQVQLVVMKKKLSQEVAYFRSMQWQEEPKPENPITQSAH